MGQSGKKNEDWYSVAFGLHRSGPLANVHVAKPKVQDLTNWQLDEDLKNSLEMDRPTTAKIPKSRSYFRHLIEALESLEQENGINEVERREDPQVYGHGKGYRYLRQYKLNI